MSCTNHPEVLSGVVACGRCGKPFCQDCVIELDGLPYDAACKEEQVRDLRSGAAELAYATAGRRWGAMLVDYLVFFAAFWAASFAIGTMMSVAHITFPHSGFGEIIVLSFIAPALLFAVYEGLMQRNNGQTIGKRAMGIKVVSADGSDMENSQVWRRAGSRFLMGITYILGFVDSLMVFSRHRRTLHDRFAKTVVVKLR
jgi:uncharacterized RDD family membrane protein YckC